MSYETFVTPALWLLALGTVGAFAIRRDFKRAGIALIAGLLIVPSIGIVPAGHRGVVYRFGGGVSTQERGEGVTLLLPWVHHMVPMSVRTQKIQNAEVFSQSRDLQEITVVASVNYRVDPTRAAELYRDVGTGYEQAVIEPALFQRMKAAVGQILAVDFAANRSQLAVDVKAQLEEQLGDYGIIIEFVNVEDGIFDPDFIQSVKQKVIADETAAEEQRLVEAERHRKAQMILQAEARAESVRIEARAQARANTRIARTLTPQMVRWQWIGAWDGIVPQVVAGEGTNFLITPPEGER